MRSVRHLSDASLNESCPCASATHSMIPAYDMAKARPEPVRTGQLRLRRWGEVEQVSEARVVKRFCVGAC